MKIITGMHRSGTSLVARLFHDAGADFGAEESFYRPDKWNPDGYFEQVALHTINMPLINGPFGKLSYFRLPSTATILKRSTRFAGQIRETAAKFDGCTVKETRFCLTLPAWLEHGASIEKVLVCLRNPLQVARSIRRRNKIPLSLGYRLWQLHNQRLLESIGDLPVHFISYEALLDEEVYLTEIQAAFSFMGLNLSNAEMTKLCAGKIRFGPARANDRSAEFPGPVRDLWKKLLGRHGRQFSADSPADNHSPSPSPSASPNE